MYIPCDQFYWYYTHFEQVNVLNIEAKKKINLA